MLYLLSLAEIFANKHFYHSELSRNIYFKRSLIWKYSTETLSKNFSVDLGLFVLCLCFYFTVVFKYGDQRDGLLA